MQVTHDFKIESAQSAGWDMRVLLLSADPSPTLPDRIIRLGAKIDRQDEVYTAMSEVIDDPRAWGLVIIDCDSFPEGDTGARAVQTLKAAQIGIPIILISKDHKTQIFPQERHEPVCLRAPLSALSLRVGMEHALRDRLVWNAA